MVSASRDERPRRRNGLSGLNGLNCPQALIIHATLAVAANLSSEWCSSGADMKKPRMDST